MYTNKFNAITKAILMNEIFVPYDIKLALISHGIY